MYTTHAVQHGNTGQYKSTQEMQTKHKPSKLDESLREAVDGHASACAHSALFRM